MKSKFGYAILVFTISLVVLVIFSLNFQQRIRKLVISSQNAERSNQVILELNRLELYIKEAESGQRGYMLSGDSNFLQPYLISSRQIFPATAALQKLTEGNLRTQNQITILRNYVSKRMEIMHFTLTAWENKDSTYQNYLQEGKLMMDSCQQLFHQLEMEQTVLFDQSNSSRQFYELRAPENFRNVFLISLLVLALSFVLIMREIFQRSKFKRELQANIIELNQMYEELQQITFITSHDFQEPLRKIRILSSRLNEMHPANETAEGKVILGRIQAAAGRIQELIQEMVQYMALSRTTEKMTRFNLTTVVNEALSDMADHPVLKKADKEVLLAVEIIGYRSQIRLLFKSLLDNSIKFAHPERSLRIRISGHLSDEKGNSEPDSRKPKYYCVTVSDNGIGFEQEFSRKIFQLFKRLETGESAPEGKGVGLALAEKIMANHKGFIRADGQPGSGAEFSLFFPVKEV